MREFKYFYKFMTNPWVVLIYFLLCIGAYFYLDMNLAIQIHDHKLPILKEMMQYITLIGTFKIYFILLPCLALLSRLNKKKCELQLWFLWTCVVSSYLACGIVKYTVGRARPELLFSSDTYGFFGPNIQHVLHSFPSGHTTTTMTLAFALSVLFPRFLYVLLIIGVLVACSRLILLQHYLSDVLVASFLSLIVVTIVARLWSRKFTMKMFL